MRYLLAVLVMLAACGPSQAEGDKSCRTTDRCRMFQQCWYDATAFGHGARARNGTYESQCIARNQADCPPGQLWDPSLRGCFSRKQ